MSLWSLSSSSATSIASAMGPSMIVLAPFYFFKSVTSPPSSWLLPPPQPPRPTDHLPYPFLPCSCLLPHLPLPLPSCLMHHCLCPCFHPSHLLDSLFPGVTGIGASSQLSSLSATSACLLPLVASVVFSMTIVVVGLEVLGIRFLRQLVIVG